MLAEQGLVGSLPTLAIYWFLVAKSYGLAFRESATWRKGRWALVAAIIIVLRGLVEASGIFGYSSAPDAYCAMIFLAIVVSRYSREEEYMLAEDWSLSEEQFAEAIPSSAFAG
jgi:hypothetical protein